MTELERSRDPKKDVHDIVSLITSGVIDQTKEKVVNTLRCLAAELDTKQRDMNIAKTAFATSGIVGTGMAIGGAIAAPFTFGASLGLTIAGVAVGVTSGVGGLATAIADQIVNSNAMKEAEVSIAKYMEKVTELTDMVNDFCALNGEDEDVDLDDIINENLNLIPNEKEKKKVETLLRGLRTGVDAGGHALHLGATLGASAAIAAGRSTVGALGAGLKVVRIGGVVLSVLTLPLDLHTLVTNSIKIHKNTPSAVADQIRDMATTLEQHELLDTEESEEYTTLEQLELINTEGSEYSTQEQHGPPNTEASGEYSSQEQYEIIDTDA